MKENDTNLSYSKIASDLIGNFDYFWNSCFAVCIVETDKKNKTINEYYCTESGEEYNNKDVISVGGCQIVADNLHVCMDSLGVNLETGLGLLSAYLQNAIKEKCDLSYLDKELIEQLRKFLREIEDEDIREYFFDNCDGFYYIIKDVKRWIDYFELFKDETISYNIQPQQEETQVIEPKYSCILPDKLIDNAVSAGLIKHSENGLRWMETASLYGYFVDKVSEKLELKSSGDRIQWKVFRFIENHDTILNTARQAVNDYTNKHLNPPEGDDIIDKILKDI